MRRSRLVPLLSLLALTALPSLPIPAAADEVIPPAPLRRKFPERQFCTLPVRFQFTSPTDGVIVTYVAQNYVDHNGTLVWTNQSIDNVSLALQSDVNPNFAAPPTNSPSENCYVGDPQPTPYFYFNAPVPKALLELFDTNPGPRGWDLSNGGYYNTAESGPRHPELVDGDLTGGSLGLGLESPTPSLSETATSSIAITGLTAGAAYELGTWWRANFVRFPHDVDYLTISISTLDGTPVARRSWGSVKSTYRQESSRGR